MNLLSCVCVCVCLLCRSQLQKTGCGGRRKTIARQPTPAIPRIRSASRIDAGSPTAAAHAAAASAAEAACAAGTRRHEVRVVAQETSPRVHRHPTEDAAGDISRDSAAQQGNADDDRRSTRPQGVDGRQLLHERPSTVNR